MATHSSTLAWKIPWMEEPGRLQSIGLLRVGHDWATSLSLSCIGEGNGNPLQCSCLENPRDGGAWWAAVSGVTQSRTQRKRLSSSQHEGKRLTPWSEQVLFCLPWVWDHFYINISSRKNQERKKLCCISLSVTFLYKHYLYMKKSLS